MIIHINSRLCLKALFSFRLSADIPVQVGALRLASLDTAGLWNSETLVRVKRTFELSLGGQRTTSGLWHGFMNEHQDAGCTVVSLGGIAKMSSSNNSATVEGLSLVSSSGSQDMKSWTSRAPPNFKMLSCQNAVWSTVVEKMKDW